VPAALFDLDGVLADSTVPITSCVNRALEATGHRPRPVAELLDFIGPPAHAGFAALIGERADGPAVAACVAAYRELYAGAVGETPPYPGVPEAVRALVAGGWRLGVATSKPVSFAGPVLDAIGLRDAFAVVAGPELDGGADKTQTVGEALERLGGAVAMAGDRRYDMAAARHHGLRAIGVTWGFGSEQELVDAGADVLAGDPDQLLAALEDAATRARLRTSSATSGP
jgi:phosphoglycolate phosphatase